MNSSYDFLVVGAGIAGLRAVCELGRHGSVLCLAKQALTESNTQYAQGGIAVALAADDSPALHLADTIAAGAGLVNDAAARILCDEGPRRVRELMDWGVQFDRDERGELAFTREGAHCRSRVLHADGDSTGREMARALYAYAARMPNVTFAAHGFCRNLLVQDGRVVGVELLLEDGSVQKITARAVLLGVRQRLRNGTVIKFDEYFNYPNWQAHEYRAWQEFVAAFGVKYRYLGFTASGGWVAVEITDTGTCRTT